MAGKNTAVFGIYRDQAGVTRAVDTLRAEGFRATDISVLFPENEGTKDFAHEKHTKAPEGAATGATSGAVIGGGLGWLAGIGALAIPALGPLVERENGAHRIRPAAAARDDLAARRARRRSEHPGRLRGAHRAAGDVPRTASAPRAP